MLEQEKEGGCTGGGQLFDTLELEREVVVLLLDFRVQQLSEQEMKLPRHRASHEAGVVLHISSSSSTMPAASSR
jgi:ribulose 1,5-bisphosphate synthetase/thiazole synthase